MRALLILSTFPALTHAVFPQGANTLFMGHSFFHPVASQFNELQPNLPNHQFTLVRSPGLTGLPSSLWQSDLKQDVEDALATKQIDLFGMTSCCESLGDEENYTREEAIEHTLGVYKLWFDLALGYNPNTSFFIGLPWRSGLGGFSGTYALPPDQAMTQVQVVGADFHDEIILKLRSMYPENNVYFINYGPVVAQMKSMVDSNQLDLEMLGSKMDALFTDAVPGHVGTMAQEMCAITWLRFLYNVTSLDDVDNLPIGEENYKRTTIFKIVQPAIEANLEYPQIDNDAPTDEVPVPSLEPTQAPVIEETSVASFVSGLAGFALTTVLSMILVL